MGGPYGPETVTIQGISKNFTIGRQNLEERFGSASQWITCPCISSYIVFWHMEAKGHTGFLISLFSKL